MPCILEKFVSNRSSKKSNGSGTNLVLRHKCFPKTATNPRGDVMGRRRDATAVVRLTMFCQLAGCAFPCVGRPPAAPSRKFARSECVAIFFLNEVVVRPLPSSHYLERLSQLRRNTCAEEPNVFRTHLTFWLDLFNTSNL